MNYAALYTLVATARNLTLKLAKVLVWLFGLQFAVLYLLASVADAPLTSLIGPVLRVVAAVAVIILAPRVFDVALRRIVQASNRAG